MREPPLAVRAKGSGGDGPGRTREGQEENQETSGKIWYLMRHWVEVGDEAGAAPVLGDRAPSGARWTCVLEALKSEKP